MTDIYNFTIPTISYFVERKACPSWRLKRSCIPLNDLTYVYSGKAKYKIDGRLYDLGPGDVIYIPKGHKSK